MKYYLLPQLARLSRCCSLLFAAGLLSLQVAAADQIRTIRLRNEVISTPPRAKLAAMAPGLAVQASASGLFLVQFDGALESGWKAELRSLGVDLVKYVPDDAFIAKFNGVPLPRIQALSYVRWVGPYRPDHKLHPRLAALAKAAPQTNAVLSITALISPQATPAEIAEARGLFSGTVSESRLRQGTFLRGNLATRQPE